MKELATNTRVIMLAIIAVSGVTLFFTFDEIIASDSETSKTSNGMLFVGNVEVVKRDGAGNIVAYRQGDNHIVLGGMELIARQVFGNTLGTSNNTNFTGIDDASHNFAGGTVEYMSIGNGSALGSCSNVGAPPTPVLGFDNTTLECPLFNLASNCLRELAEIRRENATEKPVLTDQAQINLTAVATFSGGGGNSCAAQNIGEAGLWNNATGGPGYYSGGPETGNLMFARNVFGTVNLSTSDSLELTWKFTFTDS